MYFMKQLPGLIRFMKFNGLDDDHLETASSYFEHAFFPKGSYIFKQGEQSQRFYGIIEGRVSIRIRKQNVVLNKINQEENLGNTVHGTQHNNTTGTESMNKTFLTNNQVIVNFKQVEAKKDDRNSPQISPKINLNNTRSSIKYQINKRNPNKNGFVDDNPNNLDLAQLGLEDEIFVVSDGMCFGEWALIYNIPRTASAFAAEDTDLFVMDKDCFDLVFNKAIVRADNEKKNFIVKRIPSLKIAGKVPEILKKIFPLFLDNKKIVYTEHDMADSIFLVYQGECVLARLHPDKKSNNKDEIIKNKEKLINFMRIDRGGIAGLEVITGVKEYSYNLVCSKDHTIVYKISLKVLKECNREIVEYLMPLFKQQMESLNNFKEKYNSLNDHCRITNWGKFNPAKYTSHEVQKIEEQKVMEINRCIEEAKYIKKIPKTSVNVKTIQVSQLEDDYFAKLKRQKHRRGGGGIVKTMPTIKPYQLGRMSIVKSIVNQACNKTERRVGAKSMGIQAFQEANNIHDTKSLLIPLPKKEMFSTLAITNEQEDESKSDNQSNSNFHNMRTDNTSNINSSSKEEEDKAIIKNTKIAALKKSLRVATGDDDIKINDYEQIMDDKLEKYKPSQNIKYNTTLSSFNRMQVKKPVNQTLSMWNKTLNENSLNYNSGLFTLPLISLSKSVSKLNSTREQKSNRQFESIVINEY
jgi:CRP-like cAMP-binding protein